MVTGLTSSRASPLPQGSAVNHCFVANHENCGSELARDEASSFNTNTESNPLHPMLLEQFLIAPVSLHRRNLTVEPGDDLFMQGVLQAHQNMQAVLTQRLG